MARALPSVELAPVKSRDRIRFLADPRRKPLRRQDARVFAPAQNPALDLFQAAEL